MYRNKKDVDKHVETLTSKLSSKEFKTRAYSVARLYFEVGDYVSCVKYVELYLSSKDKNAAAHKLLGQAFQKLGQKEKALEQYKTSLEIDATQSSTILDICELLTDDDVTIDPGRIKYWCEKAEAIFPRHLVTFRLRERILKMANPDPEALVKLLNSELLVRPKDLLLHIRLLKHYLNTNQVKEAFEHSCKIEFESKLFLHNFDWYEVVSQVLNHSTNNFMDWLYQLLLLTVKERICLLSITEVPSGSSKSLLESKELLVAYDQAIETVSRAGTPLGFSEFHTCLLKHHRGQLAFHTATVLLKMAKKDVISWREGVRLADPLMLIAWQTVPTDTKVNWLFHAPEKQKYATYRWYIEGCYRCSQSGHYLLANCQDKSQLFLDQISQYCSSSEWKERLFEKIYPNQTNFKGSHIASNSFQAPTLRLPRKSEVEAYDDDAQREYPNSLHHIIWILMTYKKYSSFKCTLFDMLAPTSSSCGPETLSKLDIQAFMYCAALTVVKQKHNQHSYIANDKPQIIPANITDLHCAFAQMKWWDCAYKFCQNELGTELTDIRATLSAGIEVVRCIDNHGLHPELLCMLGRIFSEQAKLESVDEESNKLEMRAFLYYSASIPLLAQLKSKGVLKVPEKRFFDYPHTELSSKELNSLIEESKVYVALVHLREENYEKVVELLSHVKSSKAYYYLGETYKRIALEEKSNSRDDSKCLSLLSKAKHFAYKALEKLKESEYKSVSLYSETQDLIEEIEACINKVDPDYSVAANNIDIKHLSDENLSLIGSEQYPTRPNYIFRNVNSSTPKYQPQTNVTCYRSAIDSQLIESNRLDHQYLQRIEKQIKNLQKVETAAATNNENKNKIDEIISTINSNTEMIAEQFKLLKVSLEQIKGQIDESKNESKDVIELKKQVAELKKEVFKLKKVSSDQAIDDNELFNLDETYRASDTASTFTPHVPFAPSQVIPPFTQRLMPPFPIPSNPYQLYGQNLYNLYNQYSQFAQPQSIPGAPIFDPTRGQMNYPNVYPTPDQMYLDVAHLIPANLPANSGPAATNVTVVPTISVAPITTSVSTSIAPLVTPGAPLKPPNLTEVKEPAQSLPVNVVITSSDPLPTCTTTPAPVLSVTIPPQHIKNSPHNYQIPMPCTSESKAVVPPKFSFVQGGPKQTTAKSSSVWNPTLFTSAQASTSVFNTSVNLDNSKVGGFMSESSPNTSINKSRTLSEKSNTSVENYDPCPDFKPIIPLPAEVKVTTGEEDEVVIFNARAKLFRFVDKQWKERGLGEMKLLQHKLTGKVRVLMRREQIHKVCANHIILPEMEIKPMKNEMKAYFWFANDFAEETVILEKFCIRFKTAEIAKQFYNAFEKARQEALSSANNNAKMNQKQIDKSSPKVDNTFTNEQNKTVIGGFSFTGTPSFKAVTNVATAVASPAQETVKSKVNVFSSLSFKSNSETPFTNLFNTTPKQNDEKLDCNQQAEKNNKLNTSDIVEEFEPAVDFKPVIPLPALVDQKTGEEDEIVLFEHRAKLLRYDASAKEWKERGLGNIKILMHKDNNNKIRLLMRREQIMKVCCNHAINKEMIFQKMPNMDKAVTWCAKDFSDGELVAETFCLRFKTVQICNEFVEAVRIAQSKIKDDSKAAKEEQNAAKQNILMNSGSSCQPTGPHLSDPLSNWGDKFKSKVGSWECKMCYVQNEAYAEFCCACNNPKTPISATTDKKPNSSTADPKPNSNKESSFSFVMPSWGDKFKPKEGTWECNQCLVRNEGSFTQCSACNNPKDPSNVTKEQKSLFMDNMPKFTFGIPQSVNDEHNVKNETQSLFKTTNSQKFTFGIPNNKPTAVICFGEQKPISSYFGGSKTNDSEQPLNCSLKNVNSEMSTIQTNTFITSQPNTSKNFGFKFTAQKETKSDESQTNNVDEAILPSSPISALKELEESVNIGENNENLIFGQRANLYKFIDGKWEKVTVGIVKVLKHKENNKGRILMRQETDFCICFNQYLTPEIQYKTKDETTWHITAKNSSDKELCLEHFCLKFPNPELASEFKSAIDQATNLEAEMNEMDDVIFVSEILASSEEKQKANELKLPENFYTYKNKPPCQGCRGCNDDGGSINEETNNSVQWVQSKSVLPTQTNICTPVKPIVQNTQSPANSLYGTPGNFNETSDVSLFRTPTGPVGYNAPVVINKVGVDAPNKESTSTDKPNVFTNFSKQKLTPSISNSQSNIFTSQPSSVIKKSILAPPKFDSFNTNTELKSKASETKSTNGGTGLSINKSLFELTTNKDLTQSSEVKSIFGDDHKHVNLFSGNTQGSIFGPSALRVDEKKSLKSGVSNNAVFQITSNESAEKDSKVETDLGSLKTNNATIHTSKENVLKEENKENKLEAPILKIDNSLTFAALSTSNTGFNIQKVADFEWEGAGQKIFVGKTNNKINKCQDISTAEDSKAECSVDEEYDPHYEPIVPLPDKITVTTGEEDEEKLFGERCKLYRYDDKSREWKERGVGEIKVLFHPKRATYRLLLRRELVHKAVLNMLVFIDLELLPMKNSDRAWTWAGINYAENVAGEQETLAVRFKSTKLAIDFRDKVIECVRKLQSAAAEEIRKAKEAGDNKFDSVALLRLPKHLENSACVDDDISIKTEQQSMNINEPNKEKITSTEETNKQTAIESKQVHFEEIEEDEAREEEEYENLYQHDDSDENYNEEEEEEAGVYFSCEGEAIVELGSEKSTCSHAHIQVVFDQNIYSPKIIVTDSNTGEVLADTLIYTDTEFQISGDSCSWSGVDYDSVNKTVTINFPDSETAMYFYDSCETSKTATCSSMDPES
ncbi:E3 SUMO-protein ligase RanBP2-like [Battus philenor]|uniref:E3 SUMO-protein ligase RanBP2-like n=1 Tax=Battus philenor TaxID=42288 RepID=UPI0035D04EAD